MKKGTSIGNGRFKLGKMWFGKPNPSIHNNYKNQNLRRIK